MPTEAHSELMLAIHTEIFSRGHGGLIGIPSCRFVQERKNEVMKCLLKRRRAQVATTTPGADPPLSELNLAIHTEIFSRGHGGQIEMPSCRFVQERKNEVMKCLHKRRRAQVATTTPGADPRCQPAIESVTKL